jgi:hypothetical protein
MRYPLLAVIASIFLSSVRLCAEDSNESADDGPSNPDAGTANVEPSGDPGWLSAWMRIAAKARASQPHSVAPLVTIHVVKGLEIIPASRLEVGIFAPSYIVHQSNVPDGFTDFSYQVKFRVASGAEATVSISQVYSLAARFPRAGRQTDSDTRFCRRPSRRPKASATGIFKVRLA